MEFASTLRYCSDPEQTARIVKRIGGEPRSSTIVSLFSSTGKELRSDFKKANAFRDSYAKVSSNDHSSKPTLKQRRQRRRQRAKLRRYLSRDNQSPYDRAFTMVEMETAMRSLSATSAAGRDDIHNRMILQLETDNRVELLRILNRSWRQSRCPSEWSIGQISYPQAWQGQVSVG